MAQVFPEVTTIEGMIRTGLYRIAGWLHGVDQRGGDLDAALRRRYPDAQGSVIAAARRRVIGASRQGEEFQYTGQHPPTGEIVRDPSIAGQGRYAYEVRVRIEGTERAPSGGERTVRATIIETVYSDRPLDLLELTKSGFEQALNRLKEGTTPGATARTITRPTGDVFIISIRRS